MITIGEENIFDITMDTDTLSDMLENKTGVFEKYKPSWNTALDEMGLKGIHVINKSFGTPDDFMYGSDVGTHSRFYLKSEYFSIDCYAHGGMAGFVYSESELTDPELHLTPEDRECMAYTFQFLRDLHEAGVIENPEDDADGSADKEVDTLQEAYDYELD